MKQIYVQNKHVFASLFINQYIAKIQLIREKTTNGKEFVYKNFLIQQQMKDQIE